MESGGKLKDEILKRVMDEKSSFTFPPSYFLI
jgi:hypothetical protein